MKFWKWMIAVVVFLLSYQYAAFAPISHEPGHYIVALLFNARPEFHMTYVLSYPPHLLAQFLIAIAGPLWGITFGILINKKFAPIGWSFILYELLYMVIIQSGDYSVAREVSMDAAELIVGLYIGGYVWMRLRKNLGSIGHNLSKSKKSTKTVSEKPTIIPVPKEHAFLTAGTTVQDRRRTMTIERPAT